MLVCHINPDGDAIGSQLALYHYLISRGKKVGMLSPNNLQEFLKWMPGSEEIRIFIKNRQEGTKLIREADLIVMLDFNQTDRMGEAEQEVVASRARKVLIDHHLNPGSFADLTISEPSVCSTAELVYLLVTELNQVPFASRSYAEAVYTGIITDTGNFVHGAYSPSTFRITAGLLESGLDKDRIYNLIYNNFSADRMRLLGYVLSEKMVILPQYSTAYMTLTREELKRFNHMKGDTEGFVNMPLSIKGILFTALMIEKEGFVKLSFRSTGSVPTNEFASRYFGGGGHLNASGGECILSLDGTVGRFVEALEEFSPFLKNHGM